MKRLAKKVLLIGWDAADWKFLHPLMDKGLMPNLSKLVEGGVSGKLATLDPPLSPTLWTSIATGKRPYKHGIHGFTEVDSSGSVRPVYISSRKVKAVWNIFDQHKLKSNIVGWWPSHPAEAINGAMVSNFYQRANKDYKKPWPMAKGAVYPPELSDTLAEFRVHPQELTGAHIQPFVPDAWKVDVSQDRRLHVLAKITAECSSIQAATTYLMEHTEWDFMAVYFDAIDHYCHAFMKYHPPHRPHIRKEDYELYKDVVKGGCRYHDMMLRRLIELAGEDTTIILISDHGFHPDHNRPVFIPREPAGPAIEHSPFGIIVMNGPGIKKDELIFGSSLLDVAPTLLRLFGLPVAEDMDGKVLLQAFEKEPAIDTIKSWEYDGQTSDHVKEAYQQTEEEMAAELQQLIDLGYIEDPGKDKVKAAEKTTNENNFYLARSYIDGGEWEEGIRLLETLHARQPDTLRYANYLARAYHETGQYKAARKVINHIRDNVDRESPQLDILEGTLLLSENRFKKALELFKKAEAEAGDQHQIHIRIANAYIQLDKLDDAERALEKALSQDPENVHAWYTLASTFYEKGDYEEAIEACLKAIGLMYYFPLAHFQLALSLEKLERFEEAIEAYDTCLRIAPGVNAARRNIIKIFEQYLNLPGKAFKYKTDFENKILGELTIVSGLPRSGTSMMMQMLEAGGMEVFTDKERTADDNNPKGYYEHELVKSLARNKKWLPQAKDKTVKIIAQLLTYLPNNFRYKIIFMERNIYEVVQSQQRMLSRNGKQVKEEELPVNLVQAYENTLKKIDQWARNQPNVSIIKVAYKNVIEAPFPEVIKIREFLDKDLTLEKMVNAVDRKLYRERIAQKE